MESDTSLYGLMRQMFTVSVTEPTQRRTAPFVLTLSILRGPLKGDSYLFSVPLHNMLAIEVIGMRDLRFVFVLIVLLNQTLFTSADVLPVRSVLDIEYHVSAKD
jgi:hypothetical protein